MQQPKCDWVVGRHRYIVPPFVWTLYRLDKNTAGMKHARPRKRDLVKALFRRTKEEEATNAANPDPEATSIGISNRRTFADNCHDRGRSSDRFSQSCKLLQQAVKACHDHWGMLEFPELAGEPEDLNDSQFISKIEQALDYRKQRFQDQSAWGRCRSALQHAFKAFSPLAKNFLTIAL